MWWSLTLSSADILGCIGGWQWGMVLNCRLRWWNIGLKYRLMDVEYIPPSRADISLSLEYEKTVTKWCLVSYLINGKDVFNLSKKQKKKNMYIKPWDHLHALLFFYKVAINFNMFCVRNMNRQLKMEHFYCHTTLWKERQMKMQKSLSSMCNHCERHGSISCLGWKTAGCFQAPHKMRHGSRNTAYPQVEWQSYGPTAQSTSE